MKRKTAAEIDATRKIQRIFNCSYFFWIKPPDVLKEKLKGSKIVTLRSDVNEANEAK